MTHWKLTGIVATLIIALSIPLYVVQDRARRSADSQAITPAAAFVGSDACRDCHPNAYDKWQGSHHQLAMAVASDETVLGDFADAEFDHLGVTTRFYKRKAGSWWPPRGRGARWENSKSPIPSAGFPCSST
jgi:hypothetical protein